MDDRKLSGYMGECGTIGYHNEDHRVKVRMKHPIGVAVSEDNVFVSLNIDRRVLSMDKQTEVCTLRVELTVPVRYLAYEPVLNTLYIGLNNGVAFKTLDDPSKSGSIMVNAAGDGTGSFDSTGLDNAHGLITLDPRHLMMSDLGNNR